MDNDITVSDLEIMARAPNYRRWLFDQIAPYVGRRVLEVGAGVGNYTEFLLDCEFVLCLDLHRAALSRLWKRFGSRPNVAAQCGDIADPTLRSLRDQECDTGLCLNVLEHIEDHIAALRNIGHILADNGRLALIVPAVPRIYGTVDRALGHHRRYTRSSLRSALDSAGFLIEQMWYTNLPGILGWFWNNRVMRLKEENAAQILVYDQLIMPWLPALERIARPPIGLSLVCIARVGDTSRPTLTPVIGRTDGHGLGGCEATSR